MRPVSVRLDDLKNMVLVLGYVGENEHTRLRIDCKTMYDQYPHAAVSMSVSPPAGAAYPAVIERDGDYVIWDITDSDLASEGNGEFQLAFTDTPHIAKTYIGRFKVNRSIIPTGTIPSGIDDFTTRAGAALTAIPETIAEEFEAITAAAETLAAGSSATASFDAEDKVLTIGVPAGADGEDGHSPVVTASKSGKVTTISVDGTSIATINDGQDGDDGYSPTATVTKSGKVVTISITDANGTTTETVSDGDGAADIIDDNAGSGDTGKVWSADKSAELLSEITPLTPSASASDVGKKLKVKTVADGKVSEYEFAADTVQDVQINGSSILSQGVANVPKGGTNTLGVLKTNPTYGITADANGLLYSVPASDARVKADYNSASASEKAAMQYCQITAKTKDAAAFYGLASAAGDSTQSASSNAVGVYTESAKSVISNMLDAPETVSGTTPSITAKPGVRYVCGEVSTLTFTPSASGDCEVIFESGSTATVLTVPNTVKFPEWFDATTLEANRTYDVIITNGVYGVVTSWA